MEIVNYKPTMLDNSATLATFSLHFPKMGMTYHNFKLIKTKKGTRFVAPPSFRDGEDSTGKPIYKPLVTFSEEKKQSFQEAVMLMLDAEFAVSQAKESN